MKRRILFVIEDYFPLGANFQLRPVVVALAAESVDVHVVALRDFVKPSTWVTELPVSIHHLDSSRGINQIWGLRSLIYRIRPDMLHAWGHETHWVSLLASIGQRELKKIVTFFETPLRDRMIKRQSQAWLFGRSVTLTAVHQSIADRLEEYGVDQPIEIIPNAPVSFDQRTPAVDRDRTVARQRLFEIISRNIQRQAQQPFSVASNVGLTEPDAHVDSKLYLIGTVARLLPGYQLKDLIWAVDLLCCIRDDIHLFIFGSGSQESCLRRFISKTASAEHIHLVLAESTDEMDLAALDCYWNGQLEAPLPSAMLAVMARQIPVISVLGTGTAELVLPLRSALATNFGARDEFARWTKFLIEQPQAAEQLAAQGAAHLKNLFPISQMIERYRRLYTSTEG